MRHRSRNARGGATLRTREGATPGWGDNLRRRSRLGLARHAQPDAILYTLWVNKMSVARDDRASLPLAAAEAEAGSYRRHLGSAEETLADYVADRCELSGEAGCGDKR
jgi:hypothetical protein